MATEMATMQMRSRLRGFTMIEAIMAIVLIGIVGGMVSVFIRTPLQSYFDTANRAVLTDIADGAIRRIARDVASALPNSLRTDTANSTSCFELLPLLAGGRYRAEKSSTGTGDILDFTATDTSFDVLGEVRMSSLSGTTNQVAIYNLGITGADAYAGDNTSTISAASTISVTFADKKFPFTSPGKAFQVIPDKSVVYYCAGTAPNITLYRTTQAISAGKMTCSSLAGGTAVATNISSCNFYYLPAVNQRDGMLSISLALTLNSETVTLYEQVMVNNAP